MTHADAQALRADAQLNRDRLLEAAAEAFAREGADTSLKAIARQAGVGIGTLYRRFPTREDLIEATYRHETTKLCESAASLLETMDPIAALREWMNRFIDYMFTKHGMSDALPSILAAHEGLRTGSRTMLRDAIGTLLDAGVRTAALRGDVPADDVMMSLGGITLIAGAEHQRELATRLLNLLIAGLISSSAGAAEPRP
ncbi:TetR/AcrR family transcriptional regulator [Streptomyces sp. NPDC051217]|uniref:TetR/AcrR family transcriptional regulator n=1 Tax=Streptomyces sp. NPDC051217 TaxID=3365644 RepID=UPI00379454CE